LKVTNYVVDDIAESGQVKVPVKLTVEKGYVGGKRSHYLRTRQGHHRIAAAYDVNPDMEVPVRHVEDWGQKILNEPQDDE
jgi:hypothetical protein